MYCRGVSVKDGKTVEGNWHPVMDEDGDIEPALLDYGAPEHVSIHYTPITVKVKNKWRSAEMTANGGLNIQ